MRIGFGQQESKYILEEFLDPNFFRKGSPQDFEMSFKWYFVSHERKKWIL